MTRPRSASCLAVAAIAGWSALSTAAPGVTGEPGLGAVGRRVAPADAQRLLEAELRDEAFRLWEAGGFGADRTERAAWVLRAPSGVAWRVWPWDRRYEQTRWLGPTPAGAFAIVHTHPAVVDPRPSPADREIAARLRIAVYTVSRSGIWRTGPDGVLSRIRDERWWAGCRKGQPCGERASDAIPVAIAGNREGAETTAAALRITE
ncbi:MAG: hypothetical protein ABI768_00620 [Acidobacteriota bacterium]